MSNADALGREIKQEELDQLEDDNDQSQLSRQWQGTTETAKKRGRSRTNSSSSNALFSSPRQKQLQLARNCDEIQELRQPDRAPASDDDNPSNHDSGAECDSSDESRRATKKQRKGARLGRLEPVLENMPIELLSDVLAYLPPVMLLRLARTAKVFRGLLMNKEQSRAIWKMAFQRDGLGPFARDDVPEPRIAALIWDKECFECGRLKVHKIVYIFQGRYCDPCLKQKVRTRPQIQNSHPRLHLNAFDCTPFSTNPPCRGGNWPALPGQYIAGEYWLEETVVQRSEDLKRLEALDAESPLESGSRVANFVQEWKELIPKIEKDAKMLQKWQSELDQSRSSDKRNMRTERTNIIRQRCVDAGFDPRDIDTAFRPESAVNALINQPYPLTDRVWRKIERPIFAQVRANRDQRLADKARQEAQNRSREEEARAQAIANERQFQELQEMIGREHAAQAQAQAQAQLAAAAGGGGGGGGAQAQRPNSRPCATFGANGMNNQGQGPMMQGLPHNTALRFADGSPTQQRQGNNSPGSSMAPPQGWNPMLMPAQYHAQAHAQYLSMLRQGGQAPSSSSSGQQRANPALPLANAISFPPQPPSMPPHHIPVQAPQPPTASSIYMNSSGMQQNAAANGSGSSTGAWWIRPLVSSAPSAPTTSSSSYMGRSIAPGQPNLVAPIAIRPAQQQRPQGSSLSSTPHQQR